MEIKEASIMRQKSNEINKDELIKFINFIKTDIKNTLNNYHDSNNGYIIPFEYEVEPNILMGVKYDINNFINNLRKLGYEVFSDIDKNDIKSKGLIKLKITVMW